MNDTLGGTTRLLNVMSSVAQGKEYKSQIPWRIEATVPFKKTTASTPIQLLYGMPLVDVRLSVSVSCVLAR